jgi:hypothetical protein
MRNKLILITTLSAISYSIYLFFNNTPIIASERIFIQAIVNSPALKNITQSLSQKINSIIKEELNLDQNNQSDFFSPKPAQRLTLYGINDLQKDTNNILISILDNMNINTFVAHNTSIKHEVEFFGGPFGDNDELVIIINDPNKELSFFNQSIKETMHHANNEYEKKHHMSLYNITKSERHPYLPHIGLGRVRSNLIKKELKDPFQFSAIFERIQSRIKNATLECINNQLTNNNDKIVFDKIVIFDPAQQLWIKEYTINNEQK